MVCGPVEEVFCGPQMDPRIKPAGDLRRWITPEKMLSKVARDAKKDAVGFNFILSFKQNRHHV
jgi:hypothetical protein